jgi:AraC-like DNA-binding protein
LQDTLFPQKPHQAQPTVKDVFLQNLYDFVNANLNEEMDPERIANEMAMSRSTLNRKLKSLTNLSITEFVRQLRLQKSLELIHAGYNISEIAYQVGFESHSYFSRCFKERFQKTPTEYAETRVA